MTTNPFESNALADARAAHATPLPRPGHLWRARWDERAGVLLVLEDTGHGLRVIPVSLDESPDESALLAPAATNTLVLDLAIWIQDEAVVPARVLDYKLGDLHANLADLQPGPLNWGATDPRTISRARLQDVVDLFNDAQWAPRGDAPALDLTTALHGADIRAIAAILGSVPRAAGLRRGQVELSEDEASRIAELLDVPSADLLAATQPPLPDGLVSAMDNPFVRSMVDRLAARRNATEVDTWRAAAYGVQALAAREHDRRELRWAARISAFFDAQLDEPRGQDQ